MPSDSESPNENRAKVLSPGEMIVIAQIKMRNPGTQDVYRDGRGRLMVNSTPIISIGQHVDKLAAAGKSGTVTVIDPAFAVEGQTNFVFGTEA